jgi:hypothetical protein
MMTAIQNMTMKVGGSMQPTMDEKGKISNPMAMMSTLTKEVFNDPAIVRGMTQMSNQLIKAMSESQLPTPPSYDKIMRKAEDN